MKSPRWAVVIVTVIAFLLLATMVGASTPARAPSDSVEAYDAKNADKVDGLHASKRPKALTLLALNKQKKFPVSVIPSAFWKLTGNAGTNPATNFLGTTGNQALELRVNSARALRLEPNATSPNLIGGYSGYSVTAGVYGATIGGGAASDHTNRVTDDYGTVGGGISNRAGDNAGTTSDRSYATVGGGDGNTASGEHATVGGGGGNTASGDDATVGGGWLNYAGADGATVPGGYWATATHYGEMAYASGRFTNSGDAQTSIYVLRRTSSGTTVTELFLDGSGERITIAAGRTLTFDILVVGRENDNGESAGYHIVGVIERVGDTTALIGSVVTLLEREDATAADWGVTVDADDINDALRIQVQGGSGDSIRWVATVRTVEVAW